MDDGERDQVGLNSIPDCKIIASPSSPGFQPQTFGLQTITNYTTGATGLTQLYTDILIDVTRVFYL